MTDSLDPTKSRTGTKGEADSMEGKTEEATGKETEKLGKAIDDRELEARGKFEKEEGKAYDKLGKTEQKIDEDR